MNVEIPCPCPPKASGEPRHAHDTITFRDRLDFRGGMVIRKAVQVVRTDDPNAGAAEILAAMAEHYMLEGITGWTLTDDKGKRIEVERTAIRKFLEEHDELVFEYLVDPADNLYYEQALLPLVRKARGYSDPSPTEEPKTDTGSTSAETGSEEKHRKPSRRSSTTTTPTAGTTPITRLHAGDSSTSRRSA